MSVITVGGAEPEQDRLPDEPTPGRQGPLLLAAGLLVGLTMGAVFAGGDTEPAVTTTTQPDSVISPSAAPTTTTTTIAVPVSRLATMAPGLTDTLVMVSIESSGVDGMTVWEPAGRSPVPANLPVGRMSIDSTHQWLASLTVSRYSERGALWVGNAAYLEPLAVDVLGMAWHSRLPGELVWTEVDGDRASLMRAGLVPGRSAAPVELIAMESPAVPVWWTDVGVVVLDEATATLRLISPEGTARTLVIAEFLSGSPSVAAVIDAEGNSLLIAPDLSVLAEAPWGPTCRSGAFAGLGFDPVTSIALHCVRPEGSTFELWRVDLSGTGSVGPVAEQSHVVAAPNGVDPGWTSDGGLAYIADPHPLRPSTELIFVRPAGGTVITVTHPGRVTQIESIRFNVQR
ncbi:MAG TPA: hypothetical protein VIY70_08630 [Acidimicrobiia bacterium]